LFGKEIEFRAHLEAELRKGKSLRYYEKKFKRKRNLSDRISRSSTSNSRAITEFEDDNDEEISKSQSVPMVLIVVQGGPNTLLTVEESLKQNVPVLVLAVSEYFFIRLCLSILSYV
jgi:hypothetical protein